MHVFNPLLTRGPRDYSKVPDQYVSSIFYASKPGATTSSANHSVVWPTCLEMDIAGRTYIAWTVVRKCRRGFVRIRSSVGT